MSESARLHAACHGISQQIAAAAPARDVQAAIVEAACALTFADRAALCVLDSTGENLNFVAAAGSNANEILGLRTRVEGSISEQVIAGQKPLLLDRFALDESGDLFAGEAENDIGGERLIHAHSAAVVPVTAKGNVIGTLSIQKTALSPDGENAPFTNEDLETLGLLADFVELARVSDAAAGTAREQSRELSVLYEATRSAAGNLNVQAVLDGVLTSICSHLEHQTAVLFLLNDERTHLYIAADRNLTDDEREVQLSVDSGIQQKIISSGEPRLIMDTESEPEFENLSERLDARSAIAAPVRSREEMLGLVLLTSTQRNAYHADDLKLLASVALQAGIAIENAWLYEAAQRQAQEAGALYELSQQMNASLDLSDVLNFVADSVINLLNVDSFALMLFDEKEDRLVTRISRNMDAAVIDAMRPKSGEGIAGWVYEWQTPCAVADVAADPRNRTSPLEDVCAASTLCVPMHAGDEVIGVILAVSARRRLFTVSEMELLYTIANQAAAAALNATRYQEARSRSHEMRRYFRRIAEAVGTALECDEIPDALAGLSREILRADRCCMYRVEGDHLVLHASSNCRNSNPPDAQIPIGQGLAGWVARRGQALAVPQLGDEPRAVPHAWYLRERLTCYLAIPLKAARKTVGVLEVYFQEPREFSRETIQLLYIFSRRSRMAERLMPVES